MSFRLTSFTGLLSIMLLGQLIAGAQNAGPAKDPQNQQSSTSPVETVSENRSVQSSVQATPARITPVKVPEVKTKNPTLEFKLVPVESKLSTIFSTRGWALSETRNFEATAYSLRGITRSGVYVRRGVIAADPRVLPLGSVVLVTAGKYTGVYTVHDTGAKIKGDIIDVWVPTTREAMIFGRQKVKVEVLKMGLTRRLK